jgi:hypothetical protein
MGKQPEVTGLYLGGDMQERQVTLAPDLHKLWWAILGSNQ